LKVLSNDALTANTILFSKGEIIKKKEEKRVENGRARATMRLSVGVETAQLLRSFGLKAKKKRGEEGGREMPDTDTHTVWWRQTTRLAQPRFFSHFYIFCSIAKRK